MATNPYEQFRNDPDAGESNPYAQFREDPDAKEPPPPTGAFRKLADIGYSFGQGLVGGTKALTDSLGADNVVSQKLGKANEVLSDLISPARKAEIEQRQLKIKTANESGSTLDQVGAYLGSVTDAPVSTVAQLIGSTVPTIATAYLTRGAGPAAAALARIAPAAVGFAQGVGTIKGGIYEGTERAQIEAGKTPEQAAAIATQAQSYNGENLGQIGVGGVLGAVAGKFGLEGAVSRLASGVGSSGKALVPRVVGGALSEGIPEGAQGGQEQYAVNSALIKQGLETDPYRGVIGSGALEAVAGGLAGGGLSAIPSGRAVPAPAPTVDPNAGPISRAASLALPAPVITADQQGGLFTADQRQALRDSAEDVPFRDVTPVPGSPVSNAAALLASNVPQAPAIIEPVATEAIAPQVQDQALRPISVEEADARDQAAYDEFFANTGAPEFRAELAPADLLDDNIPWDEPSSADTRTFLTALGATDQEIEDAIAQESSRAQTSNTGSAGGQTNDAGAPGPTSGPTQGGQASVGDANVSPAAVLRPLAGESDAGRGDNAPAGVADGQRNGAGDGALAAGNAAPSAGGSPVPPAAPGSAPTVAATPIKIGERITTTVDGRQVSGVVEKKPFGKFRVMLDGETTARVLPADAVARANPAKSQPNPTGTSADAAPVATNNVATELGANFAPNSPNADSAQAPANAAPDATENVAQGLNAPKSPKSPSAEPSAGPLSDATETVAADLIAPKSPSPAAAPAAPVNEYAKSWFGSAEKAQAFLQKKGAADRYDVVKVGPTRFEVKPKEQLNVPQANQAQQTEAQRPQVEAAGDGAAQAEQSPVSAAPGGDGVQAAGVGATADDAPGSDAGNGFKQGPKTGERYRVGVVQSVGGALTLEKRLPAGTAATFYLGKDGNLIDADSVNLVGTRDRDRLWLPKNKQQADEATAILDEMGKLPLDDPKRADAKKRLKVLVSADQAPAAATPARAPALPSAPAPAKRTKADRAAADAEAARADYFTPGNIVNGYGGLDEVLAYNASPSGSFSVTVQSVKKIDGEWVREGRPDNARTHSTRPEPREMKSGPVERLPFTPGDQIKYTGKRADGKPFPNVPDRGIAPDAPIIQPAEQDQATPQQAEKLSNSEQKDNEAVAGEAASPADFIPAPEGGLDYGEITPEMSKAMRRQAGKIRLQRGDSRFGLAHIERRHGDEIRKAGFPSVEAFVADIARNIVQIWQPSATSQLVALKVSGNDRILYVQLQAQANGEGDFYTVNTAFPARSGYVRNKKDWKKLWEGRAQPSQPATSGQAPFAESPQEAGEATTIPSGQRGDSVPLAAEKTQAAAPKTAPKAIEDFGEKLTGARKDYAALLKDAEAVDVSAEPLSKSWPEPDYQKLLASGVDPFVVGWVRASRDEVPTKPQKAWKLKGWVESVKLLRAVSGKLLDGSITKDVLTAQLAEAAFRNVRDNVGGRAELYQAVGHEKSLKGLRLTSRSYTFYKGQQYPRPGKTLWHVEQAVKATAFGNWPREIVTTDTREQAVAAFKEKFDGLDLGSKAKATPSFVIYSKRGQPGAFIGKKIGREYVDLHKADDLKAARAYLESNTEALEQALAQYKDTPYERSDDNAPRVGADHRRGALVTPQVFSEAFGFRGVQFGNYVEQGRRQSDLNEAYDALMDMAAVLELPPRALSLGGRLGLAFGARGKGGKNAPAAHYEPGLVVINLTKGGGPGSLAHEWFHAMDNYFAKEGGTSGFMTDKAKGDALRAEMRAAFLGIRRALQVSGVKTRSVELDKRRSKPYWSTPEEMAARTFESYVIAKLQDQSASNDYLANVVSQQSFEAADSQRLGEASEVEKPATYPYPTEQEMAKLRTVYDEFFKTVQTKQDDAGNTVLFSRQATLPASKGQRAAQTQGAVDAITKAWQNGPEIIVVRDMQDPDVPEAVRKYDAKQRSLGADGTPEGFYFKGKVYVVASMMRDANDVARVVFHEALGHFGLQNAFGSALKPILKQVATMRAAEVKAKAVSYGLDVTVERQMLLAAEEVLAEMAQTRPELGFVRRAIAAIRTWLRANVPSFNNLRMSDDELVRNFILPAREFVERGRKADLDQLADNLVPAFSREVAKTDTPEFRRWYSGQNAADQNARRNDSGGASGVSAPAAAGPQRNGPLDDKGRPVVFYHGTRDDVGAFDLNHPNRKDTGWLGRGVYGTSDPEIASTYANLKRGSGGPRVMPLYFAVTNPYQIDLETKRKLSKAPQGYIDKFTEKVKARGHDGVMLKFSDGTLEIVAFEPSQVKSAIGNNGDFDPANPDVLFSRATGAKDVDALKAKATDALNEAVARTGGALANRLDLALNLLTRRQIVDVYEKDIPELKTYSNLVQQMDADKNEVGAQADQLADRWGKLRDEKDLAELMHDATLARTDPALPFAERPGEKPLPRGARLAQHKALTERFNALSDEAKAVYRETRDAYRVQYDNIKDAIRENIERSIKDEPTRLKFLDRLDTEFFKDIQGVYFPLARFGDYLVNVRDAEGGIIAHYRAETLNEANHLRAQLVAQGKARGWDVGKVLKSKEFNARRDLAGKGFVKEIMDALKSGGVDENVIDSVAQLYLQSLPDLSWAKHGIHRKGTPGFSQDARRAFASNMFFGARYLAKLRYSDKLLGSLATMQEQVDSGAYNEGYDSVAAQKVVDHMNKRHDSLMNPDTNPVSTALTSVGFIFHLGLSPASALVNLSQTALVAYPMLGAKWGFKKSSAALLSASKLVTKSKNDLRDALTGDEKRAYDNAVQTGTIDVTQAHDLAGIAQGEDSKVAWKLRPVMKWASFLFHHAERFNRQVTFLAAYRLARETGTAHEQAVEQATKATIDGHFDYSASNRAKAMQGNVARVVLLFKQYAQNMIYTLSRQAFVAMQGQTKAERSEARKALGGLLTMHALAAGVFGLPLVSTLLGAASALGGDDDEPWDAKVALQNMLADALGPKAAEVLTRGVSRLTPWDISGRVGLDKLLLPDIQEGLEGARWFEAAATSALGPVLGIGLNAAKGIQDIAEGRTLRGFESMVPAALRGPLKSYRYATEGNIDKTGVPINDSVSAGGVVGQAFGFSPSETRAAQEVRSAIYSLDSRLQDRRKSLLSDYAQAYQAGDEGEKKAVAESIQKFNQANPQRAIRPMNLIQSLRNRQRRINEAEDGLYLPKNRRDVREQVRFGQEAEAL